MSRITADLHEAVLSIARDASDAIMRVYAEDFAVEHKADNSPLTRADLAAHRIIADGLARLTPDLPLLSEEGAKAPWAARQDWHAYWLVDPLDGTREFVKRNGEFTVNIALIEAHQPVFGVIMAPVTGTLWHAQAGQVALRRDGQTDRELRTRQPARAPLRVAASRSHRDPRTQAVLDQLPGAEPVPLGSSLKFCRLAEGALDVYPRFGPTCEWDTAAGQCILEAAGGALLAPDGRAFRYNRRESLLNGDFMALGDPTLPWRDWL
ncbi:MULTISPECIES: 3'(2'),5'-bisphosphate nucleotidase CysQ [Pseudoxanthomonas]|jgi:3'(2'), 5'-bisphosphate nucleotidase|uniref:3'(2'),5'-bisphosphate nucleotidase CysQ n=1 Tax=Pseudoxanthomonas winnipegensis TaxID=2480810 RepID=A0A4Q8LFG0_9GAMM|nr:MULTISPECIES: 3'(2'),5'-bisphosphate nucleotidase CysQ [Pseudoxanthomonas]PZP59867.1 MAG: 3'(2'),5'-bisphosphate nucleotidase [Pseudoxanthomonas spadix]TAA28140.1 3'(2'),5'-bisphosphate nucleotidase [Pseudoxanthomonas winnipegensis]TMN20274.1 3'(2'),5'-bisphosphate nucleotidase CysQ [Pseudoxanthomonas sp. X-1]UAY73536.1 3'(2'),5'-bisphosphate nucleotidase CysQ [Pseudoxanthomonas sp. X-1]